MYLYFYGIFNLGHYVGCYLFGCYFLKNFGHNVHLRLLRIHTDSDL